LGAARSNTFAWSLGYFRTLISNDILTLASPIQGRGFFIGGDTLREGVKAALKYRSDRLFFYATYAFVNATFRNALEIASPGRLRTLTPMLCAPSQAPRSASG
jgi:iron complex outermembrane recepter protein